LAEVDDRRVAGLEIMAFRGLRIHDQVKIRRIHISVGKHFVYGKGSEGSQDAGFARASLSADDDQFFHL
jgi:hypothetical protein